MRVSTPTRQAVPAFDPVALCRSIPDRFDAVARAMPDRCAVRSPDGTTVTYDALRQRTDRIRDWLLAELADRGQHPGSPAGIPIVTLLPQGVDAVSVQIGILKAGCPYVPLDPRHPPGRLGEIVDHVGTGLVVTGSPWLEVARRSAPGRGLSLDARDGVFSGSGGCAPPRPSPHSHAYIYYTSGSTGKPKGVVDSHRNVLHNVLRYTRTLKIGPDDRLTLLQSPAFSGAVSSTYCALLNGATLCPYDLERDGPDGLADWLVECGVTVYHSVPSIFRALVVARRAYPAMRIVRLEGDRALATDVELFRRHFPPACALVNGLGTTETGIAAQFFVDRGTQVEPGLLPVGHPTPDTEILILDAAGHRLPQGMVGEIAVRSRYLALGYWRDPARTRARFLEDPEGGDRRIYRTGDAGRLRADGCLEYLGRRDFVLRVHGHAVDPAEVEHALTAIPGVTDAGVTGRVRDDGEVEVVAFVVVDEPGVQVREIRDALRGQLPDSMIPAVIVRRDALPLTPFGKLDRNALLRQGNELRAEEPPPDASSSLSEIEGGIARIWSEVLGTSVLDRNADFLDCGGDSLKAMQVVARIRDEFRIRGALTGLYRLRTVAAAADFLTAVLAGSGERPVDRVQSRLRAARATSDRASRISVDRSILGDLPPDPS